VWHGASRFGEAGGVRCDSVRLVQVRSGEAGKFRCGQALKGAVRFGRLGYVWPGMAWQARIKMNLNWRKQWKTLI
jgi:hypothetical protein